MRQRTLNEAELKYIDDLVNESFNDTVKNWFGNAHRSLWGNKDGSDQNQQGNDNYKSPNYLNMSLGKLQKKQDTNGMPAYPTKRSQWSQFWDTIQDLRSNGQYSQRKNQSLNTMGRYAVRMGTPDSHYWLGQVFDYWGQGYKKNVTGEQAAQDFLQYVTDWVGSDRYSFANDSASNGYANFIEDNYGSEGMMTQSNYEKWMVRNGNQA